MKRVLIPGVILCGADVAQAVDDKNMYMHVFMFTVKRMIKSAKAVVPTARLKPPLLNITTMAKPKRIRSTSVLSWPNPCISAR